MVNTRTQTSIIADNVALLSKAQTRLNQLNTYVNLHGTELESSIYNKVDVIQQQFLEIIDNIHSNNALFTEAADQTDVSEIETQWFSVFCKIKLISKEPSVIKSEPSTNSNFCYGLNIPKFSLPKFNGNCNDWLNFFNLFNSSIHENSQLSPEQKLHILRNHLSGNALLLIESLPISAENYKVAYDILTSRYNNKRSLLNSFYSRIKTFHSDDNKTFLSDFKATYVASVNGLKSLKVDLSNFLILQLGLEKLPNSVRIRFESNCSSDTVPSYEDLIEFLTVQEKINESLEADYSFSEKSNSTPSKQNSRTQSTSNNSPHNKSKFSPHIKSLFAQNQSKAIQCPCCSEAHKIYGCKKFQNLSHDDKINFLRQHNLCFKCLGTHNRYQCTSQVNCKNCNSPNHHTFLCQKNNVTLFGSTSRVSPRSSFSSGHTPSRVNASASRPSKANVTSPANNVGNNSSNSSNFVDSNQVVSPDSNVHTDSVATCLSNHFSGEQSSTILLGTAIVPVEDAFGKLHNIRAVLDCGSQRTLITKSCLSRLSLPLENSKLRISGIDSTSTSVLGTAHIKIHSLPKYGKTFQSNALVVQNISGNLPTRSLSPIIAHKFQHLHLADPTFFVASPIDILIGSDLFCSLLLPSSSSQTADSPSALNTVFGYVILGNSSNIDDTDSSNSNELITLFSQENSLDNTLRKFWEIEEVNFNPPQSPDDIYCEKLFQTTTTRNADGRYVVALPISPNAPPVANNRPKAFRSFHIIENRLLKNPNVYSKYNDFMQDYINSGHMTVAKTNSDYVIPHHCVFKKSDPQGKIRVVFNASAPDSTGLTLNDRLLRGPKLQKDISLVITSFRFHKVVVTADCRQMYRQILLRPEDRKLQHIFWRPPSQTTISEFELNTVTYGMKPSAYLAQRVIKQLVSDEGGNFPLASHALSHHIYVDDLVTGTSDLVSAEKLISELISLLALGGFELRKWCSNQPSLLANFPEDFLGSNPTNLDKENSFSVLGSHFCAKSDQFQFHVTSFDGKVTKRSLLSYIAGIFDPLGWLTPVTFSLKLFMQQLWLANLSWDEPISDDLNDQWFQITNDISALNLVQIPRQLPTGEFSQILVGFCDASSKGYAANLYLHTSNSNHFMSMQLLAAKSRVAPLKRITIPRLELNAALLLAKLLRHFLPVFSQNKISEFILFSDSQVVLSWISTPTYQLQVYEANRVSQILEITSPTSWHHVKSSDNAADIASRGTFASQLPSLDSWWKGPSIFHVSAHQLPIASSKIHPIDNSHISDPCVFLSQTPSSKDSNLFLSLTEKCSSLPKMLGVIAHIVKFISKIFRKSFNNPILVKLVESLNSSPPSLFSPDVLDYALLFCVQTLQFEHFSSLIQNIDNEVNSSSFAKLTPILDDFRLIRVGGRLHQSELPHDAKHPLLLPKKSNFSTLLVRKSHLEGFHCGPRQTQALLSQRFWIPSARSLIRKIIRQCVRCQKFRPTRIQPIMADLPSDRVTAQRAFSVVGTDFAGPFSYKSSTLRSAKIQKGYLCIFVCFASKAVHLEFVSDLSTPAFIAALTRFVSRRGLPHAIYSDNGSNFIGASRHLKEVYDFLDKSHNEIFHTLSSQHIRWHFNPPYAPNFGGLWESVVKSTKYLLFRTFGDMTFTFEEFSTIFCRIESILNSRPLTSFSLDPVEDSCILTPGHFLIGSSLMALPEFPIEDKISPRLRWTLLQQRTQHFWNRWSKEYLHELISRSKWTKGASNISVGDVVIVKAAHTLPLRWPIGRISEVFPGKDGICRTVRVRLPSGNIIRPVSKIHPLILSQ